MALGFRTSGLKFRVERLRMSEPREKVSSRQYLRHADAWDLEQLCQQRLQAGRVRAALGSCLGSCSSLGAARALQRGRQPHQGGRKTVEGAAQQEPVRLQAVEHSHITCICFIEYYCLNTDKYFLCTNYYCYQQHSYLMKFMVSCSKLERMPSMLQGWSLL